MSSFVLYTECHIKLQSFFLVNITIQCLTYYDKYGISKDYLWLYWLAPVFPCMSSLGCQTSHLLNQNTLLYLAKYMRFFPSPSSNSSAFWSSSLLASSLLVAGLLAPIGPPVLGSSQPVPELAWLLPFPLSETSNPAALLYPVEALCYKTRSKSRFHSREDINSLVNASLFLLKRDPTKYDQSHSMAYKHTQLLRDIVACMYLVGHS